MRLRFPRPSIKGFPPQLKRKGEGGERRGEGQGRKGTEGWVKSETGQPGIVCSCPVARRALRLAALPHPASRSHMLRHAILSLRSGRTFNSPVSSSGATRCLVSSSDAAMAADEAAVAAEVWGDDPRPRTTMTHDDHEHGDTTRTFDQGLELRGFPLWGFHLCSFFLYYPENLVTVTSRIAGVESFPQGR